MCIASLLLPRAQLSGRAGCEGRKAQPGAPMGSTGRWPIPRGCNQHIRGKSGTNRRSLRRKTMQFNASTVRKLLLAVRKSNRIKSPNVKCGFKS